jgi:multiple antibiotic resistance protein
MIDTAQVFTFLFLMLGPFKIIAPYAKMTLHADPAMGRQLAFRGIAFATIALILASVIGDNVLGNFGIPVEILALAGGIILFLVALRNTIRQFDPPAPIMEESAPLTLKMAINPLAFPTIVTPYGMAALIVFMAISPDMQTKLVIGGMVLAIMAINLAFMLLTRKLYKIFAVILPILGAILGVVQVALGLMIIFQNLKSYFNIA